jgi:hypothetical protein
MLIGSGENAIVASTALGAERSFPFDRLAAVSFEGEADREAGERFAAALAQRLPGQDVLITRSGDGAKTIRGRLVELGPDEGTFEFGQKPRSFKLDKMFGLVFAAGSQLHVAGTADVELIDENRFSGDLISADARRIRISTRVGFEVEMDVASIRSIELRSPRVVFVSDLSALREETEGLVHAPAPVRRDLSVARRPLTIDGRVFDRGLGVHSRTTLEYRLAGEFESFAATIGIDDWVRPRGSVIFRLLSSDGTVLFDSGEVTGQDPGRNVLVDVTGVEALILVVDYGEALDVSDHADWGGARLIRKATR